MGIVMPKLSTPVKRGDISKNKMKMLILGVGPSIYWNTVANLYFADMVSISTIISYFGSIKGTPLRIMKISSTYDDCSEPLIKTGSITPCFNCYLKKADISAHRVDPLKR